MHRRYFRSAAPSVHYTTSCKISLVVLRMGEIIARNMLSRFKPLINGYYCVKVVVYFTVSTMHGHTNIKMRNCSDKSCRQNQNAHFVFSNLFSENRAVCVIMWERYCRAGQAADGNMAHACALHGGYLNLQTHTLNV